MKNKRCIILKQDHIYKRIVLDDLVYVKVEGYVLTCVLGSGTAVSLCQSMKAFRKSLPSEFVQIDRSKIINLDKVIHLDKKSRTVTLTDHSRHKVAARRVRDVFEAFSDTLIL